jgi:hypothetical protein
MRDSAQRISDEIRFDKAIRCEGKSRYNRNSGTHSRCRWAQIQVSSESSGTTSGIEIWECSNPALHFGQMRIHFDILSPRTGDSQQAGEHLESVR